MNLVNELRYNGIPVVKIEKSGKTSVALLQDGSQIFINQLPKGNFEVRCHTCQEWQIKKTIWHPLNTKLICSHCHSIHNNGFKGKKHTEEYKRKSSERVKGKYDGEKNPFYGKRHSEKTKKTLSNHFTGLLVGDKNPFYGRHHTEKTCQRLSEAGTQYAKDHPEVVEAFRKRSIERLKANKFGMTSIERLTKSWLNNNRVENKYNFILKNKYQFDFLIKNTNIIIEVQGDYWHANPRKYGIDKKPLNDRQKFKVDRDKVKKEFAESNGYQIRYIWEYEIRRGDFSCLEDLVKQYGKL